MKKIKSLFQAIKLKLKQAFCQHLGYEAKYLTIINDDPPSIQTKVDAKCLDCGVSNSGINRRALDQYDKEFYLPFYKQQLEKLLNPEE